MSPARRRAAVECLQRRHKVSERRACKVVGQNWSTQRHSAQANDFELKLVAEMNRLAGEHPRWGYRRVHALLVEDGWKISRKRVERLWRLEGIGFRRGARSGWATRVRVWRRSRRGTGPPSPRIMSGRMTS